MRSVFKLWVTYFRKIFEKLRKYSLITPEIEKKKENQPKNTQELRKKRRIGSNAKKLGKLEPQLEQTFLL